MKKLIRNVLTVCFICYMILLVYFLFFSEEYGRNESYSSYQYNLVLFCELKRYLAYRHKIGNGLFLVNVVGNVLAFAPFRSFWFVSLMGFLFSLCVEVTQLITKVGCFDVDDLFLNTTGVMIGFIVYFISKKIIGVLSLKKKRRKNP